jgi:hypothetical protein
MLRIHCRIFSARGCTFRAARYYPAVLKLLAMEYLAATAITAAPFLSGCAFFGGGSVTDKAAYTERLQCDAATAQDDLHVIQAAAVLEVEGHYDVHESGISRVTATRVLLRPPQGVTADRMTRILQCHNARMVLGRADPVSLPDDPYSLPNTWLDISVKEQDGNYVVLLSADRVSDNIRVLKRAQAFAASHRPASASPAM